MGIFVFECHVCQSMFTCCICCIQKILFIKKKKGIITSKWCSDIITQSDGQEIKGLRCQKSKKNVLPKSIRIKKTQLLIEKNSAIRSWEGHVTAVMSF